MHLIGRYHKLRAWTPVYERLSAPLLYDTKWSHVRPCGGEEWWKSPAGIWRQVQDLLYDQRGVVGFVGDTSAIPNYPFFEPVDSTMGNANTDLNTAYTAGSAGVAIGSYIVLATTRTLNSVYFYVHSFTGTQANVNDINIEVRSSSAGVPDTTGPGLLASGTVNPNAASSGWNQLSGLSQVLTGGTFYWLIAGDADGNGTDFATLRTSEGNAGNYWATNNARRGCVSYNSGNGWTTQAELTGRGMVVGIFSDGTGIGMPFTIAGTPPSSTAQRGLILTGLTEQLQIYGMAGTLAIAGTPTMNVWSGSNGPGGSPQATGSVSVYGLGSNSSGVYLSAPYTLAKSTQYRLVLAGSSASTIVRTVKVGTINTGSAADLMKAAPGRGAFSYTEESGGTWANDDTTTLPIVTLFIQDQVAVAAGGPGSLLGGQGGLLQG